MRLLRPLAAGLALLSLAGGWSSSARAAIAYGFAEQTITSLSISPAILNVTNLTASTSDGVTVNGSGVSQNAGLVGVISDVPEAYSGGLPQAPPNSPLRYAPSLPVNTGTPGPNDNNPPVSPVGNFTRGDAVINPLTGALNSSTVVAESYLNAAGAPPAASESGTGSLRASLTFTTGAIASALSFTYTYQNDIFTYTDGGQGASAEYAFNITIKDLAGNVVYNSALDPLSAHTNLSLVAPPPGGEIIRTGTDTLTSGLLAANTVYTLVFSSSANTGVNAVPEPSVFAMLGVAGLFGGLGYYRKSRGRFAS